jgi:micrococcal nuclease
MIPDQRYHYRAKVLNIVDADTVDLNVDLGFGFNMEERFRLNRINAWEVRGSERPEGLEAKAWLSQAIPEGSTVYIKTHKDRKGKYGRYLTEIHILEDGVGFININDELVRLGHAIYKDYR